MVSKYVVGDPSAMQAHVDQIMGHPRTAPMSVCSRCGETKPITEFGRDKSKRDGLHHYCRPCAREKGRRWREANKIRRKAK